MKVKTIITILLISCLVGCGQFDSDNSLIGDRSSELLESGANNSNLAETTAPKIIRKLSKATLQESPQLKIVAPKMGQVFQKTDIEIELALEDFAIFKDKQLGLGNHLNLIIDNEPLQEIYSIERPIIIENLTPGTHTLRVFAVRPWGESIKTNNAYAQTTFSILTETQDNLPNTDYPLLTYNSPTGTYGAEPILLDFYLSNSDFKLNENSNLEQYAVKATANGTSFIINDWQPYYLTGFEPGDNWIQLQLVNNSGEVIENAFNNTVRVFNYNPQQENALAALITEGVSYDEIKAIAEPDYDVRSIETPETIDVRAIAEPEIIIDQPQEKANELTIETTESDLENKINLSEIDSVTEPVAIAPLVEQKSEDIEVLVEDNLSEQVENANEFESKPSLVDSFDQPAVSITENASKLETEAITVDKAQKIIISEPSLSSEPVAEIIIPQPNSVEITESEIAITIPESKTQPDLDLPERSSKVTLWWKKILVGIRQTIESLAKKLPNEV